MKLDDDIKKAKDNIAKIRNDILEAQNMLENKFGEFQLNQYAKNYKIWLNKSPVEKYYKYEKKYNWSDVDAKAHIVKRNFGSESVIPSYISIKINSVEFKNYTKNIYGQDSISEKEQLLTLKYYDSKNQEKKDNEHDIKYFQGSYFDHVVDYVNKFNKNGIVFSTTLNLDSSMINPEKLEKNHELNCDLIINSFEKILADCTIINKFHRI